MRLIVAVWIAVVAILLPTGLEAQILYGSLVGNITDPSGGAIVAAGVAVTDKATNLTRRTYTDAIGAYRFLDLPAGTYELRVEASGFATVTRTGLPVSINNITRADVRVELAAVSAA